MSSRPIISYPAQHSSQPTILSDYTGRNRYTYTLIMSVHIALPVVVTGLSNAVCVCVTAWHDTARQTESFLSSLLQVQLKDVFQVRYLIARLQHLQLDTSINICFSKCYMYICALQPLKSGHLTVPRYLDSSIPSLLPFNPSPSLIPRNWPGNEATPPHPLPKLSRVLCSQVSSNCVR